MSNVLAQPRARLVLIAAVLVIFLAGLGVLVFANGGPAPQQRLFDIQVVGTRMTPSALAAYYQDTITMTVHADRAEEIHLHGYDKHFFPDPSRPVTLSFPANLTGTFVIEIEATSTPLGKLVVQPRGGLLSLGQASDQSSTTVVKNLPGTLTEVGSSPLYNLSLEIGPVQPMYSPQQVQALHPKRGEIMFSGQMVMPPGMEGMTNMDAASFPPNWRHLEVHVYDKKTGDVVRNLEPVITVTASGGQSQPVPIVTMQGIADGPKDFHYGNNVVMPPASYVVDVQVGDQRASFDVSF